MYGLNDRNKTEEMQKRYDAMVNVFSDILACGRWDIETLFDSENNIEVGEIVKRYVEDCGSLPNWNTVYHEAMLDFTSVYGLKMGKDIDIYTNSCLDTHIYVKEGLDEDIEQGLESLFNMNVEKLV